MRILIIGNPISGGGRAGAAIENLATILIGSGHEVETFLTQKAGDAFSRAGNIDPSFNLLIIAGGDGTINEILNGLTNPGAIPILPFAQGTANMLSHELHYPRDPESFPSIIEKFDIKHMDMGLIKYDAPDPGSSCEKRFFLITSSGFDAMVTKAVFDRRKGSLGYIGYVIPLFQVAWKYIAPTIEVTIDDKEPINGSMVVIGNTKNYGGFFSITDMAEMDSGSFDIAIFTGKSRMALISYSLSALFKSVSKRNDVVYRKGKNIRISAKEAVPVEVDGDYLALTPVEVAIQPGAIKILCP